MCLVGFAVGQGFGLRRWLEVCAVGFWGGFAGCFRVLLGLRFWRWCWMVLVFCVARLFVGWGGLRLRFVLRCSGCGMVLLWVGFAALGFLYCLGFWVLVCAFSFFVWWFVAAVGLVAYVFALLCCGLVWVARLFGFVVMFRC